MLDTVGLVTPEQLQPSLNVRICRVQLGSPRIRIQCIGNLVVARLVQCSKVVPDFGNVGIEADGARIGVKRVAILVNLIVEDTNGAPKGWVARVAVDCLLVGFVGLGILAL